MSISARKEQYEVINFLRFVAAGWILIFHAQIHFGKIGAIYYLQPIIQQGVLAMSVFFVLSGFILSYRYASFSEPGSLKKFYIARIARLYPVYLFTGFATIWTLHDRIEDFPLANFGSIGLAMWTAGIIVLFIFAMQAWFPSLFGVWNFGGSWSLSVEAFFYMLFPALRGRISSLSSNSLWMVVICTPFLWLFIYFQLIVSLSESKPTAIIFYSVPIYRLPEFIFGIAAFVLFVERRATQRLYAVFALACAFIGLSLIYTIGNLPGNLEYTGFFLPAILVAITTSMQVSMGKVMSATFNYLGRISYSVYLAQFGTVPLFKKLLEDLPTDVQWAFFITSNLLLALIVYHFVEAPLHAPVKRLLGKALSNGAFRVERAMP